jgi:glycosyltransferase involved in cell wall biosynthesis
MRIGINATCINDRPSGARQRFVGLLPRLARLMPATQFVVFEPKDCRMAGGFAGADNVITRRTPLSSKRRWRRYIRGLSFWPRVFAKERFDLFEALHMPVTRAPNGKTLLTIHDVRGLYPESGWLTRQLYRRVLRTSLRRADRVVTVSHAMREEILSFSDVTPVSVICNGLELSRFSAMEPVMRDHVAARLRLPARYLLAVGHFEPRKNYRTLVDALTILQGKGTTLPLVIVGNDSGERQRIEAQAAAAGLRASVRLLSGLTGGEVRCAYYDAAMLVFPSLYEGFGIPLLEAMASNIPVVASDIPVFREILGDAGVYFDPHSAESMASAIGTLLASPGIRAQLVARNATRVKDFDFEVLARDMATLYQLMLAPG